MIGRVRILSGMAMSAKTTIGTQSKSRIATTTPRLSAPSQFSHPSENSRRWSGVSRLAPGRNFRQCFLTIWNAAIGPAMALFLEGLIGVRQQPVAVTLVGVMRQPAVLDDGEQYVAVAEAG